MIEKVLLNVTLKAGEKIWEEGSIETAPLPQELLDEIYANTGTVTVLEGDEKSKTKLVFVAKRVEETATSMTTMAVSKPDEPKPKPKLLRRR